MHLKATNSYRLLLVGLNFSNTTVKYSVFFSFFEISNYFQDLGLDYGVVSESFETSVPWDR